MSNILPTIGPATESFKNITSLLKFTKILRLNGAHNTLLWHERISKKIKKINPNSKILLDVPGVKARCRNKNELLIKKDDVVLVIYNRPDIIKHLIDNLNSEIVFKFELKNIFNLIEKKVKRINKIRKYASIVENFVNNLVSIK